MVEVLGGLESQLFGEFVKGFTSGFLALRANVETILSNLKTLANHSPFPCFVGKDALAIIDKVYILTNTTHLVSFILILLQEVLICIP